MPSQGSTTQRGYGYVHQQERKKWEPKVRAGGVKCSRCKQPIDPDAEWHLDHSDDRTGYNGPAHASCNLAVGGRAGAAVTNARWSTTIREWE